MYLQVIPTMSKFELIDRKEESLIDGTPWGRSLKPIANLTKTIYILSKHIGINILNYFILVLFKLKPLTSKILHII